MSLSDKELKSVFKLLFFFLFILNPSTKCDTSVGNDDDQLILTNKIEDLTLQDFIYTIYDEENSIRKPKEVDCFGFGSAIAKLLEWLLKQEENKVNSSFVHFYMVSRRAPRRVKVYLGGQFGLEWTDFNIRRPTIIIIHGFLSSGTEEWTRRMEKAFLMWGDVNVIVVDWSQGSNTWNYYKAAVNTNLVGSLVAKLFESIENATLKSHGPPEDEWGKIHFVGHSLGAHICSFASNSIRESSTKWKVERITGLDPAQPCFRNADKSLLLDKSDAPFVDVIHTNGKFLTNLGLGLPGTVGHVDFYPNGGKIQPGCSHIENTKINLPITQSAIKEAICSHGRSYTYFTESILSSVRQNCTFWASQWDLTYRHAISTIERECDPKTCSEMGINSANHSQRGTFFVLTSASPPYCNFSETDRQEVLQQLRQDLEEEFED